MRLITANELDQQPESVLHSKFFTVSQQLAQTEENTTERANALGSLENINRAIIARRHRAPGM